MIAHAMDHEWQRMDHKVFHEGDGTRMGKDGTRFFCATTHTTNEFVARRPTTTTDVDHYCRWVDHDCRWVDHDCRWVDHDWLKIGMNCFSKMGGVGLGRVLTFFHTYVCTESKLPRPHEAIKTASPSLARPH